MKVLGALGPVAIVALLLLAGCQAPPAEVPPENGGGGKPDLGGVGDRPGFDGVAARAFVEGLITNDDGSPRYRVPGKAGHAEAAQWLWDQMQVDGWTPAWQNFTYADYEALEKGAVTGYAHPDSCPASDRERLQGVVFHNLMAVHYGDDGPSDRLFLLGAHWESKEDASQDRNRAKRSDPVLGANDGASGVGVLLQLMRHVADGMIDVDYDVGVLFVDGEDGFQDCHPLAGSITYVASLEPGEVDRFLLLDMVGDPAARFMRESGSVMADPTLVDLLWHFGRQWAPENFLNTEHSVLDDHVPFLDAGIPAADLIDFARGPTMREFPPYWHTTEDTLDKVTAPMLGTIGDIVVGVMTHPEFDRTLVPQ